MSLEQRINRAWYGKPDYLWLLLPLEFLYRAVVWMRRAFIRPLDCGVPVVVVGNLNVGGSGKTPVVLALIEHLIRRGLQPGVISRGYGAKAPHYPFVVDASTQPAISGDEPALIARRTGVPVVVSPDRPAGIRELVDRFGCNIIVSDDGLQHYRMARDLEVLVIDAKRLFGNRHCLPVGPLREPVSRAQHIPIHVLNGADALEANDSGGAHRFPMQLVAEFMVNVDSGESAVVGDWLRKHPDVNAVAGIGHPQRFFDALTAMGAQVNGRSRPDHHRFVAADLQFNNSRPLVMTEKDAVKCREFATENCWMMPVTAALPEAFYQQIDLHLERALATRRTPTT